MLLPFLRRKHTHAQKKGQNHLVLKKFTEHIFPALLLAEVFTT